MRVLHIITGLSVGGAETMLVKLLEHMDRSNYQPMVISLTTMGELGPKNCCAGHTQSNRSV